MSNETALSGMKEITEFCGQIGLARTDDRVHQLRREEGLPMVKTGGIWESDTEEIREWRRVRVRRQLGLIEETPAPKKKKRGGGKKKAATA